MTKAIGPAARRADRIYNLIVSIAAIVCMWAVWLVAYCVVKDEYVVPSFTQTFKELSALLWADGASSFWTAFGMTLARTVYSWLVALIFAAAAASLCAVFPRVRKFVSPFIAVFRIVPTMAITLMLLIWSTPQVAPTIVAFLMVFPLTFNQFMAAFDGADRKLADMAKVYGVPLSKRLAAIYIPQMLPPILAQVGPNLSLTLKVIISAEVMCSTFNSLGGLIYGAAIPSDAAATAQMFALTICAIAVGGLLEWALGKLTYFTRRWTDGSFVLRSACSGKSRSRCARLGLRTVYNYGGAVRFRARVRRIEFAGRAKGDRR